MQIVLATHRIMTVEEKADVSKAKYLDFQMGGLWLGGPMVRASVLPLRMLFLEHGADAVFTEEIVAQRLIGAVRSIRTVGCGPVIEYRSASDNSISFATSPVERDRVILQLGVADADTAVAAANTVLQDVAGIDVNMGCPKKFSVKNRMGGALLKDRERARSILVALRSMVKPPQVLTCKIRLVSPHFKETVEFLEMCEAAGVDAVTLHARFSADRPKTPARWVEFFAVQEELYARSEEGRRPLPLIFNGDLLSPIQIAAFFKMTTATQRKGLSYMLSRGALRNPAIFALKKHVNEPAQISSTDLSLYTYTDYIKQLFEKSIETGRIPASLKWLVMEILLLNADKERHKAVGGAKTLQSLIAVLDLQELADAFGLNDEAFMQGLTNDAVNIPFRLRNKRKLTLHEDFEELHVAKKPQNCTAISSAGSTKTECAQR